MRVFIFILVMVVIQNYASAEITDSERDYIMETENEEQCLEYVESLNVSESLEEELNDQCMDQAY